MQTANTMIPLSPDIVPSSWESGQGPQKTTAGLPPAQGPWKAVMENIAATHGGVPAQDSASGSAKPMLAAPSTGINRPWHTICQEEGDLSPAIHAGDRAGTLPANKMKINGLTIGREKKGMAQPSRSGESVQVETDHWITPSPEGRPAVNQLRQTEHGIQAPAPEPMPGTKHFSTTHDAHGQHAITDASKPSRSLAPTQNSAPSPMAPLAPQLPENQHMAQPQPRKQPALTPIESMLSDSHLAKANQKTTLRTQPQGHSEKLPPETGHSLPGRPVPPQSLATTGGPSFDIGRSAPSAEHALLQPSVATPAGGRYASSPSMAAEMSATGSTVIRDDGTVLRIEHPLFSAAGTGENPMGEDGRIRPDADLPPATREMRILSSVIEKAYWHQENGRAQARIQLKPAFLGHLHLNVLTDHSRVSVEIRVETPLAREFIEMNLQALKTDLQDSGLEIDKINVIVDPDTDNHREQSREPGRKQNRQFGTPDDRGENTTAENQDPQNAIQTTGDRENSINYFA